jgi:hypothetical protein
MRWLLLVLGLAVAAACGDGGEPSDGRSATSTMTSAPTSAEAAGGDIEFEAPDPDSLPRAIAPAGLGQVDLPDRPEEITRLFERMVPQLGGRQRVDEFLDAEQGRISVSYGDGGRVGCARMGVQAMDISVGGFYPRDWNADKVIALFSGGADWNVEAFGRDGDVVWVNWDTTCGSEGSPGEDVVFATSWGRAGSHWVFVASAGDPAGRDELTSTFVAAVS